MNGLFIRDFSFMPKRNISTNAGKHAAETQARTRSQHSPKTVSARRVGHRKRQLRQTKVTYTEPYKNQTYTVQKLTPKKTNKKHKKCIEKYQDDTLAICQWNFFHILTKWLKLCRLFPFPSSSLQPPTLASPFVPPFPFPSFPLLQNVHGG